MLADLLFGPGFLHLVFTADVSLFITSVVVSHGLLYFGEACYRGLMKPNGMLCIHHVLFFVLVLFTFHSRSVLTYKARLLVLHPPSCTPFPPILLLVLRQLSRLHVNSVLQDSSTNMRYFVL